MSKPCTETVHRIPVKVGRRRYVVVHDQAGVIRVEYINSVMGALNLDLTGRTAKRVLATFNLRNAR